MSRSYLPIDLNKSDLAKKLEFNIFIQEYDLLNHSHASFCEFCRDYTINFILENNRINLNEKQLALLTHMVQKWEVLKKIEKSYNSLF